MSVIRSRRQFHRASLWWEDPGPTAAQCLLGPRDLNAIDHAMVNGVAEIEVTGLRDVTTHQGSIFFVWALREWGAGPAHVSSGGSSSRSKQADSTGVPGSGRALGRATDVRPSTSTHHHHGRSGLSYISRR